MRGWTSDFYTHRYTEPVAVSVLPADFDCAQADELLDAPPAPEVQECRRCDPVACNRLIRQSGNTLKPDCAAFLVMDAPPAPRKPAVKLTPAEIRACILNALRGGKIMSLYDIMDATGLLYGTARNYVAVLLEEERVAGAGWRNTYDGRAAGQQRLYCLPEHKPADVIERKPRKERTVNQAKELCAANDARLLATLREQGPVEAGQLARLVGLSDSITRKKLRAFRAAGVVEQVSPVARAGYGRNTPALWRMTEEGHAEAGTTA